MSKKFRRIIAGSFFVLVQCGFNTIVKGMEEFKNDPIWREASRHIIGHCNYVRKTDPTVVHYDPKRKLQPFYNIEVNDFNPNLENYKTTPHLIKYQNNSMGVLADIDYGGKRVGGYNAVTNCQGCIQAESDIKEIVRKKYSSNKQLQKKEKNVSEIKSTLHMQKELTRQNKYKINETKKDAIPDIDSLYKKMIKNMALKRSIITSLDPLSDL